MLDQYVPVAVSDTTISDPGIWDVEVSPICLQKKCKSLPWIYFCVNDPKLSLYHRYNMRSPMQ